MRQLIKGCAIEEMADSLLNQAGEVRSLLRAYQAIFDRVADSSGLTFWVNRFRDVQEQNPDLSYKDALIETIRQWLQSDEYVARYGADPSDEDFLSFVYLNILGRDADQDGFNYWLGRLQHPTEPLGREQLVVEFTESDEFKNAVDHEADAILQTAARLESDLMIDDPAYDIPDGNVYAGELANEAPIDIVAGTDIDENAADGTPVTGGLLRVVDVDGEETHVWKMLDDAGGRFVLDDETAQSPRILVADGSLLNHEDDASHTVRVQVTDRAGNRFEKDIAIAVNDVNEAPRDLQVSNTEIDEMDGSIGAPGLPGAIVGSLAATDDDGDDLTYSIVQSDLPGALKIVGDQIAVANALLIDSEAGITAIQLTIRATDPSGASTEKTISVLVRPIVDEDPTKVLPVELAVAAMAPAGFEIAPLMAEDPDTSPDSHTFEIAHDPTGGGFAIDATGKRFLLADPEKISSTHLIDGGLLDADGVADGYVVVPVMVQATDSQGNQYTDTIHVTVDQSGVVLPFTDTTVEVLEGTDGNDTFTANAGYGPVAPVPGFNRTANAGDIGSGEGGYDRFILTKQDNNYEDGTSFVSGVRLNDVESVRIVNRDKSPLEPEETLDLLKHVCTPCIEMPVMAPNFDDPVIFEASLSPDIDHLAFGQSLGSVGVWDLQADFWSKDPLDPNDPGPVVDVFDVTGDFLWIDSDPQAKLAGAPVDEIVFNLDEVLINGLLITENASGNEPGIQRPEQVGAIRLVASGVPSVVGSINNGPGIGGFATPSITSTLTIVVPDLTGTRPTPATGPAAAAANTAAIDFFAGQTDGIGDGLLGLENVNIEGGGDVFLVFGSTANKADSDGDSSPLEIVDGAGSSFFFFERNGFSGVSIDAGEGFDTVGVYHTDLNYGPDDTITGVERIKVVDGIGSQKSLHMFDDTTQEIVFAGGIISDLALYNIPDIGGTTDQAVLCSELGEAGFIVNIDQCCFDRAPWNDHQIPDRGDLPTDFNLFLDADGTAARVDLIMNIDPGNPFFPAPNEGTLVDIRNLQVKEISTLHIRVEDCDDTTDGVFEVRHLGSHEDALETLLLTDDGNEGTTRILQDPDYHLLQYIFGGLDNPFRSTGNLSLINGVGGVRNQEFLRIEKGDQPPLKFLPVLEHWGDDFDTARPGPLGFQTFPGRIVDELVVSDDGAVVNLGDGNDLFTGNRLTADGTPDALGADVIKGNGGNDLIFGAAGNDQIEGGTGDDELQGELGDDCIWGNEGDDLLNGGKGSDYVDGGIGDDVIFGGIANDILRGGEGDDAICGDDGDDCLFGEDGNDLLIGGRGDDFLDAGTSGTDVLVGDYNCEPCYVRIAIPTSDFEVGDVFAIRIDWDGDGVVDLELNTGIGALDTPESLAASFAATLATLVPPSLQDCYDFSADGHVLSICKFADAPPLVEFIGIDRPEVSVHKSELDAQIGEGDTFTWDVTWEDGGVQNEVYAFRYSPVDFGAAVSADGIVDTIAELKALAQAIADDFNGIANLDPANDAAAAALRAAGFSMEVDGDGRICLIGPDDKTGQTPAVAVSAQNGDGDEDNSQSLDEVGQTAGVPPIEQDFNHLIDVEDKSEASQDVFVASARNNDAATFAADGYDNDLMPQHDFRGLMKAAGLEGGANGTDGGVEGVVYVLDFNQGGGLDDLSTYNVNEAFDKTENTSIGGRFGAALKDAFDGDLDRVEGDKLAFRKSDGELDECGATTNYAEAENVATNRDDADANAVNAFNANNDLRYHVNARTFEDALFDNHGLQWGIDVDQADVDTALADLADGWDHNDVGGIWLGSKQLIETMTAAKGESWLRVYYNEAGTDAAPEAVMELVGLDSKSHISFADIVGADCIDDCDFSKDPIDICDPFIL